MNGANGNGNNRPVQNRVNLQDVNSGAESEDEDFSLHFAQFVTIQSTDISPESVAPQAQQLNFPAAPLQNAPLPEPAPMPIPNIVQQGLAQYGQEQAQETVISQPPSIEPQAPVLPQPPIMPSTSQGPESSAPFISMSAQPGAHKKRKPRKPVAQPAPPPQIQIAPTLQQEPLVPAQAPAEPSAPAPLQAQDLTEQIAPIEPQALDEQTPSEPTQGSQTQAESEPVQNIEPEPVQAKPKPKPKPKPVLVPIQNIVAPIAPAPPAPSLPPRATSAPRPSLAPIIPFVPRVALTLRLPRRVQMTPEQLRAYHREQRAKTLPPDQGTTRQEQRVPVIPVPAPVPAPVPEILPILPRQPIERPRRETPSPEIPEISDGFREYLEQRARNIQRRKSQQHQPQQPLPERQETPSPTPSFEQERFNEFMQQWDEAITIEREEQTRALFPAPATLQSFGQTTITSEQEQRIIRGADWLTEIQDSDLPQAPERERGVAAAIPTVPASAYVPPRAVSMPSLHLINRALPAMPNTQRLLAGRLEYIHWRIQGVNLQISTQQALLEQNEDDIDDLNAIFTATQAAIESIDIHSIIEQRRRQGLQETTVLKEALAAQIRESAALRQELESLQTQLQQWHMALEQTNETASKFGFELRAIPAPPPSPLNPEATEKLQQEIAKLEKKLSDCDAALLESDALQKALEEQLAKSLASCQDPKEQQEAKRFMEQSLAKINSDQEKATAKAARLLQQLTALRTRLQPHTEAERERAGLVAELLRLEEGIERLSQEYNHNLTQSAQLKPIVANEKKALTKPQPNLEVEQAKRYQLREIQNSLEMALARCAQLRRQLPRLEQQRAQIQARLVEFDPQGELAAPLPSDIAGLTPRLLEIEANRAAFEAQGEAVNSAIYDLQDIAAELEAQLSQAQSLASEQVASIRQQSARVRQDIDTEKQKLEQLLPKARQWGALARKAQRRLNRLEKQKTATIEQQVAPPPLPQRPESQRSASQTPQPLVQPPRIHFPRAALERRAKLEQQALELERLILSSQQELAQLEQGYSAIENAAIRAQQALANANISGQANAQLSALIRAETDAKAMQAAALTRMRNLSLNLAQLRQLLAQTHSELSANQPLSTAAAPLSLQQDLIQALAEARRSSRAEAPAQEEHLQDDYFDEFDSD